MTGPLAPYHVLPALIPATVMQRVPAPSGSAVTDTANIQAALDLAHTAGGGVVVLAAGTYLIQGDGTASHGGVQIQDNCALAGAGMGVTTLKVANGAAADITGVVRTPSGVANAYVTLRDFSIDGNSANVVGTPEIIGVFCGVTPQSTSTDSDVTFERVEVHHCTGYGFDPHERTTRLRIVQCNAHHNGTDGFTLDGCYDFLVEGCTSYSNTRHGFNLVTASQRGRIVGCTSAGNGSNGYTGQNGAKQVLFDGCRAYNNTGAGWVLNGVAQSAPQLDTDPGGRHVLTGCIASLSGTHGFQLVGASDCQLVNCSSWDASQAANNTSDHYRIAESGSVYSQRTTLNACTWGQTAGVANAAKYGIEEQSANDGPSYIANSNGAGTATGATNLLHSTSLLLAARPYVADTPAAHGYLEWNYLPDLAGASAGVATVGGTIYGMRLDCQAGRPVTKIIVGCGTVASGLTANQCKAVVIDSSGVEVARNDDISGLFASTGPVAITVPSFTPVAGQTYETLLLFNGTTPPQLLRSSATSVSTPNAGQTSTSPRRYFTAGTTQTAIATPVTMSGTTATGALALWHAWAA